MNRLTYLLLLSLILTGAAIARTASLTASESERKPVDNDNPNHVTFSTPELDEDLVIDFDRRQHRVDIRPATDFTSKQQIKSAPFTISYNAKNRYIEIIGREDAENAVTISLVPTLQGPVYVRIKLSSGGVASGETMTADFPLYPGPGTTLANADDEGSEGISWGSWVPDDAAASPLVRQIFYLGGDLSDYFDNQTDIPSFADGDEGDDTLLGGSSTDWLRGDKGDDFVRGRGGDDQLDAHYGNNKLLGGDGDDYLEIISANANTSDTNILCGGDGSDHLIGHHFSNNELAGAAGGDTPDGYQDTLEGFENTLLSTRYSYTQDEDTVIVNDNVIGPNEFAPSSDIINCN